MSRDTNQNLYAEQIITESPFYYDEYGRLRARVLQEEVANLKAAEDEEEKKKVAAPDTAPAAEKTEIEPTMKPAVMPSRGEAKRELRSLKDEKRQLKASGQPVSQEMKDKIKSAKQNFRDRFAKNPPVKGGPVKPISGIKPIAAVPSKETAEPVDVINAPNLRDTTDDTVYSTMPTQDKIKRGGNQSLPPLRPYLPSDDPTLRGAPTARPAVGIGRIGKGRVTDMRARLPGRGRITGINRRPIGGVRGGGTNVNVRPTRPGSSGNMYAESVEQSEE
jgi:hypothetical protein